MYSLIIINSPIYTAVSGFTKHFHIHYLISAHVNLVKKREEIIRPLYMRGNKSSQRIRRIRKELTSLSGLNSQILFSSFYRCENWNSKKVDNLPRTAQYNTWQDESLDPLRAAYSASGLSFTSRILGWENMRTDNSLTWSTNIVKEEIMR